MHRLPHAVGEDRIRLGDPGDSAPDGPAHGDVGAFGLVGGRGPDAPAQPGRAGQLGEEPVPFVVSAGGPAVVGVQLIKLGVQTLQAIAVLTGRRLIQQRMDRAVSSAAQSAASPAARPAVRMPRRGLASNTAR